MKMDQSPRGVDTQPNNNTLNETVSQWQSRINASKSDDTRSLSSPTDFAVIDTAPIVFDESVASSKNTKPTTSLGVEAIAPKDPKKEMDPPAPPKVESKVVGVTSFQTEDLNLATDDAKSMIMDEVLESAVRGGDEAKTKELLAHTDDLECKSGNGATPLLTAARYKHESIVKLLLKQGANPGARADEGQTTLHRLTIIPIQPISGTLVDLLLKHRPPLDVPTKEGRTPLIYACQNGEQSLAKKLINHGANIQAVDKLGLTPLHWAAYCGKAEMTPLLLANGAALEAQTPRITESYTTPPSCP